MTLVHVIFVTKYILQVSQINYNRTPFVRPLFSKRIVNITETKLHGCLQRGDH